MIIEMIMLNIDTHAFKYNSKLVKCIYNTKYYNFPLNLYLLPIRHFPPHFRFYPLVVVKLTSVRKLF